MNTTCKERTYIFSDDDYNSGDGMLTSIWGPGMWHYLHTISFNYPNNPTGGIADLSFFKDVVDFGIEFDIAIMHDACYAEVTFDDYIAMGIALTWGESSY